MSDFYRRLVEQTLGVSPLVYPVALSPQELANSFADQDAEHQRFWDEVSTLQQPESRERAGPEGQLEIDEGAADDAAAPVVQPGDAPARTQPGRRLESAEDSGGRSQPPQIAETQSRAELRSESSSTPSTTQTSDSMPDATSEPSRAALHSEIEQNNTSTASPAEQTRTDAAPLAKTSSPHTKASQPPKTAEPSSHNAPPAEPASHHIDDTPVMTPSNLEAVEQATPAQASKQAPIEHAENHHDEISATATTDLAAEKPNTKQVETQNQAQDSATHKAETTRMANETPDRQNVDLPQENTDQVAEARNSFQKLKAIAKKKVTQPAKSTTPSQFQDTHTTDTTSPQNQIQDTYNQVQQSAKSTTPSPFQDTHNPVRKQAQDTHNPVQQPAKSTTQKNQVQDTHTNLVQETQAQDTHNPVQQPAKSITPSQFQDTHNPVRDQAQDTHATDTASIQNQVQDTHSPFQDTHTNLAQDTHNQIQKNQVQDTNSQVQDTYSQVQDTHTNLAQDTHNQIQKNQVQDTHTHTQARDVHQKNQVQDTHTKQAQDTQNQVQENQVQDTHTTDTASTQNRVRDQVLDTHANNRLSRQNKTHQIQDTHKQSQDTHTTDLNHNQDTHTTGTASPQTPFQNTQKPHSPQAVQNQDRDTHTTDTASPQQSQNTHTASVRDQIQDHSDTQAQDVHQVQDTHSLDTASLKTQAVDAPTQDIQTPSAQKDDQSSEHAATQATETQAQDTQATDTASPHTPDTRPPALHRVRKPRQSPGRQAIKAFLDQEQAREQATKQQTDPPIQRRRQTAQTADTQKSSVAESSERTAVDSKSTPESNPTDGPVDHHVSEPTSTTHSHETRHTSFDAPPTTVSEPTDFLDTDHPRDDGRPSRRARKSPEQVQQPPTQTKLQQPAPQESLEQKPKATTRQQTKSIQQAPTKPTKKSDSSTVQQASTRPTRSSEQRSTLGRSSRDQKLVTPSRSPQETRHQTSEQAQTPPQTARKPSHAAPASNQAELSHETQPAPGTETEQPKRASKPKATTPASRSKTESTQDIDRQIAQASAEAIRPIPSEQPAETTHLAPNANSAIRSTAPDSQVTQRRTSPTQPVKSPSKPANLTSEDSARQSEPNTNIAQTQKIGPTAEAPNTTKSHTTQAKTSKSSWSTEPKSAETSLQRLKKPSPQAIASSQPSDPVESSKIKPLSVTPTPAPKAPQNRAITKPQQTTEQTKQALQPRSPEQLATAHQPTQAESDTQAFKIIASPTQDQHPKAQTDQSHKSPQTLGDQSPSNRHKAPSDPKTNTSRSVSVPRSTRQAPTSPLQQKSASSDRSEHTAQKPSTQKAVTNLAPQSHDAAPPLRSYKTPQKRVEQTERPSKSAKITPAASNQSTEVTTHPSTSSKPEQVQAKRSATKSTSARSLQTEDSTAALAPTKSQPVQSKARATDEFPETKPRSTEPTAHRSEPNAASQEPATLNTEAETQQATTTNSPKTDRFEPKAATHGTPEAKPAPSIPPIQSAPEQPLDSSRSEPRAASQEPTTSNTRAEHRTEQKRTRSQARDRIEPKASATEISEAKAEPKQLDSSRFEPKAASQESRKLTPVQSKTSDEIDRKSRPAKPKPHKSVPAAKTRTSQTAHTHSASAAAQASSQTKHTKTAESPQVHKAHSQKETRPKPESTASVPVRSPSTKTGRTDDPPRSPQIIPEPSQSTPDQTTKATKPQQVVDAPQNSPRFEPKAISRPEPILQTKAQADRQTTAVSSHSLNPNTSQKSRQTNTPSTTQRKTLSPEAIKHPPKPVADAQPSSQKRAEPVKSDRPAKASGQTAQSSESITPVLQKESTSVRSTASSILANSQRVKTTTQVSPTTNEPESATSPARSTTSQRLATPRHTEKPTTAQSQSPKAKLGEHSPKTTAISPELPQAPNINQPTKDKTHRALAEAKDRSDQAKPRSEQSNQATPVTKSTKVAATTQTQQAAAQVVKPSSSQRSTNTQPKHHDQRRQATHMSADNAVQTPPAQPSQHHENVPKTEQKLEAAKQTSTPRTSRSTPLDQAPIDRAISPQADQALQTRNLPKTQTHRTSSEAVKRDPQTTATPAQAKSISPVETAPTSERSRISTRQSQNRSAPATSVTKISSNIGAQQHQTQIVSRKTSDTPVSQAGQERFADNASIKPDQSTPIDNREVRVSNTNPLRQSAQKTEPGLVERHVETDSEIVPSQKPKTSKSRKTRVERPSSKRHQTPKAHKTATPLVTQPPRASKATAPQSPVKETAIHTKSSQPKRHTTTPSSGPQMTNSLADRGKTKASQPTTRTQESTKPQMMETLEERHVDIPAQKPSKTRVTTPSSQQVTDTAKHHSETSPKLHPATHAKRSHPTTPTATSTTSTAPKTSTKPRPETPAKTTQPTSRASTPSTTPQVKDPAERRLHTAGKTPQTTALSKMPTSSDMTETLEERHVEIPAKPRPMTNTKTSQPTTRTTASTSNTSAKTQLESPVETERSRTSTPSTTSQIKDTVARRRKTDAKTPKTTARTTTSTPSPMSETLEERHVEIPAKTPKSKAKSSRKTPAPIRTQADPLAALIDQDSQQTSPPQAATFKVKGKAVQNPVTGNTTTDNSLIETSTIDTPESGAPAPAKTGDNLQQLQTINVASQAPKTSLIPTERAQDEPTLREEHIMIDRDPKPAASARQGHPVFAPMIERISRRRAKPAQSTPWVDWGDVLKPAPKAPVDMPAIQRHLDPTAPQLVDGPFGPNTSLPITPIEPPPVIAPSQELNAQPAIKPAPAPEPVAKVVEKPTIPIAAPQERQTLHQNIPSPDAAELGDPNILLDPDNPPPPPAPQTRVRDLSAFSPFDTYGEADVGITERIVETDVDTTTVDVETKPFTDIHERTQPTADEPLTLDDLQRANAQNAPLASRDIQVTARPKAPKKEPLKVNVGRVEVRSRKPPAPPVRETQIVQPSRTLAEFLGNAP